MSIRTWCMTVAGVVLLCSSAVLFTSIFRSCRADGTLARRQHEAFFSEPVRDRSIAAGDEIVKALDKYRERHGKWPSSLQELVPDLLPAVVPPLDGLASWDYALSHDATQFNLAFGVGSGRFPVCYYSHDRGWQVDF